MTHQVLLLPGAVLPAALAYGGLLAALPAADAVAKELEVYADESPPAGYGFETEIAGVLRAADVAGFERFHLVGYSAGGAIAAATAARHPDRLMSLALLEPAWIGAEGMGSRERRFWREHKRDLELPPEEFMARFVRAALAPGVDPPAPPPGPPPAWLATRPTGIAALTAVFDGDEIDWTRLNTFPAPVYFALGGLSNRDQYGQAAERCAQMFADFSLEVFADRHHFDPPHRAEPERLARSLLAHWDRSVRLNSP